MGFEIIFLFTPFFLILVFSFLLYLKGRKPGGIPPDPNIPEGYHVLGGRILKNMDPRTGLMRIKIDYPPERAGEQINMFVGARKRYTQRRTIRIIAPNTRAGDKVLIAGLMSEGVFYGMGLQNLTTNYTELLFYGGGKENKARIGFVYKALNKAMRRLEEAPKIEVDMYREQAKSFEVLVTQLFEKMGFKNVRVSGGASDKGVDIEAYTADPVTGLIQDKIIIQCKHQGPLNKVKPTQVRDFAHTIEREKTTGVRKGYFVTSSYFSPECYDKENSGNDMVLIDRDHLEKLLNKYDMSIKQIES